MQGGYSRRSVLAGMGGALTGCGLVDSWLGVARAAEGGAASDAAICLTMIYTSKGWRRFDARRYKDTHLPLLRRVYGDSLEHVELRLAARPARNMPEPPIMASVHMWIRDLKAFGEKTAAAGAEVQADFAKVTEASPYVQYDRTLAIAGAPRASIGEKVPVFSTYFPAKTDGRWEARHYVDTVLPKMVELYGMKNLERLEVAQASAGQGGSPPAFVAATHLYVKDLQSFMNAGRRVMMELAPEGPKYTNIFPVAATLNVAAAG